MVLIKRNLQSKAFLFRKTEKKIGAEISIRGTKDPLLSAWVHSKCLFLSFEALSFQDFIANHSWRCLACN